MYIILQVCEIISSIAAVVAIIISVMFYINGLNRERRIYTLKVFSEIRKKYPNSNALNENEKKRYLSELEYFATGINEKIYDIKEED